jgi:hypothetical protein
MIESYTFENYKQLVSVPVVITFLKALCKYSVKIDIKMNKFEKEN